MRRRLRGSVRVLVTGAAPEQCLNRFAAAAIAFWEPVPVDALHLRCWIYRKDLPRAEQAALRALCTLEKEQERGLPRHLRGLRRRPVLVFGVIAALVLTLLAQNFVWVVRIEGNETLSTAQLTHALWEEGVGFGTWGPGLSSQLLRHRMQLRLPRLEWLAANREGGVLTVLVAERDPTPEAQQQTGPANVVAARAGIVTSVSVLGGTAAVEPGDAVTTGELLISGITTWENRSQLTRATGEVYALTDRQYRVVLPAECRTKQPTGETEYELTLIVGRKRRKIFGNSRIFPADCDKMINRKVLTLPGGDALPLALELTVYRSYETAVTELDAATARALLTGFAVRDAERHMIAGRVLEQTVQLTKENGCWVLTAELSCEEMISRAAPISLLEEDAFGKADQRRTD